MTENQNNLCQLSSIAKKNDFHSSAGVLTDSLPSVFPEHPSSSSTSPVCPAQRKPHTRTQTLLNDPLPSAFSHSLSFSFPALHLSSHFPFFFPGNDHLKGLIQNRQQKTVTRVGKSGCGFKIKRYFKGGELLKLNIC